jgi:small conductance mechanosensitive channel
MMTRTLLGFAAAMLAQPAAQDAAKSAPDSKVDFSSATWWEGMAHKAGELLTEYGMRVVGALVFLAAAWVGSSYLVRVTVKALTKAHLDVTLAKFLSNLVRWGLLALVVLACLQIFGVPATSFVTVLGTVGLAIGRRSRARSRTWRRA